MKYHLIFIDNETGNILLDTTDKCGISYYNMDRIENKPVEINSVQYAIARPVLSNNNNSFAIKLKLHYAHHFRRMLPRELAAIFLKHQSNKLKNSLADLQKKDVF